MGVLTVDDCPSEGSLSLLKQQRVLSLRNGRRLQAEHRSKCERPIAELSLCHRHDPICGEELVFASRPCLLNIADERYSVQHQCPIVFCRHEHVEGCGVWFCIGPSDCVMLDELNHGM